MARVADLPLAALGLLWPAIAAEQTSEFAAAVELRRLFPGVNDDEEHIRAVLAFIRPHQNVIDYELLPYHRFGESKYNFLGGVYELEDFRSPTPESLRRRELLYSFVKIRSAEVVRVPFSDHADSVDQQL
jgi:hypothetical protein